MTPSRLSSRWMYAQSGRTRSCAGAARRNNRASSVASSSSAGSGQPSPPWAALSRYSETVPTPIAQAWAIARWDNPPSCLRRRISRIFLTSSLRAGIASPSFRKTSVQRSGYRRAFTMTGFGVQLPRIRCSTSRIRCSTSPDSVFSFRRIQRSRSAGLRSPRHTATKAARRLRPDVADRLVLACSKCPASRPSRRRPPRWSVVARTVAAAVGAPPGPRRRPGGWRVKHLQNAARPPARQALTAGSYRRSAGGAWSRGSRFFAAGNGWTRDNCYESCRLE